MNIGKIYKGFLLLLAWLFVTINLFSQTLKAGVDRDKIFIGEQIKLKVAVEGGRPGLRWFNFPDSVNHFEIINRGKIDTVVNGGSTNYYQVITITSFDSGRWEFPSMFLPAISQPTPPISIDVLPVDVSAMQDYNDIKDIEEVAQENDWSIFYIIAAITLLSIAVLYWLFKRKKKVLVEAVHLKENVSPLQWALDELNKLQRRAIASPPEVKKYYSDLVEISRVFFHRQFQQHLSQQTTDEWILDLHTLAVDSEIKTGFFQVLRLADTVKFAKYLPHSRDNDTSVEVVKNMLQKASLLHATIHSKYQHTAA